MSTSSSRQLVPQSKTSAGDLTISSFATLRNGDSTPSFQLGVDGKIRCRHVSIDTALLFIAVVAFIFQFGLYDYYFVAYGNEYRYKFFEDEKSQLNCTLIEENRTPEMAFEFMWYFFLPDLLALLVMVSFTIVNLSPLVD